MEELIKKYCESDKLISYKELPKLFGLSINDIVKILSKTVVIDSNGFIIYDNDNNPIYKTERSSYQDDREFWTNYDNLGRVIYNCDNNGRVEEYTYDEQNRLKIVETNNNIITYKYDKSGKSTYTTKFKEN